MHRTKQPILTAALVCALSLTGCSFESFLRLAEDYPEEETARTDESGAETSAAETRSAEEINSLADDILGRFRDRFRSDPDGSDVPQQTDSQQEGFVTEPAESGGLAVCGYEPAPNPFSDEMLIVPEEINGQKVTAVGESGFSGADYAHLVLLPETVTYFGEYAFKGSSVTEFSHRAGEIVMADYCFKDCPQLSHIIFRENPVTLGEYCFDNSGAGDISGMHCRLDADSYCFTDMPKLEHVVLDGDITLGEYCFENCPLLSEVVLGEGTIELGNYSFMKSALNDLVIRENAGGSIGEYCFMECWRLEDIIMEEGITEIGDYAFSSCRNLSLVMLPASIEKIGSHAFSDCGLDIMFQVPADSAAEAFCKEQGFEYTVRD